MPREIKENGTTWALAQAYAGLSENSEESSAAAQVEGAENLVHVVATPSGGAQTVRLQLKTDWEKSLSDEELLEEIKSEQK
jgi:hypothetical protein